MTGKIAVITFNYENIVIMITMTHLAPYPPVRYSSTMTKWLVRISKLTKPGNFFVFTIRLASGRTSTKIAFRWPVLHSESASNIHSPSILYAHLGSKIGQPATIKLVERKQPMSAYVVVAAKSFSPFTWARSR